MTGDPSWNTIPDMPEMRQPDRSGLMPVNGIEMHCVIYGDGNAPTLLLIHEGLAHADTRGHGRSSNDASAYDYGKLAANYLALMDALDTEKTHVVGWSDEANIGYELSVSTMASLSR